MISGNPLIAGSYNIQLSATNASGAGYGNLALTVKLPLPVITSSPTADGLVNAAFNYTIPSANVATVFGARTARGIDVELRHGRHHRHAHERRCLFSYDHRCKYHRPTTNNLTVVIYTGVAPVPVINQRIERFGRGGGEL